MTRILLHYVLPLLLPMAVFVVYSMMVNKNGEALEDRLRAAPWFWLVIAGFALMIGGLILLGIFEGNPPDTTYRPPVFEDGRVVPGEFK